MNQELINYIIEANKELAIKKELKFSLKECLSDLTKNNLTDLAGIYEIVGRHKMKKDMLVDALCSKIQDANILQEDLVSVDDNGMKLLQELRDEKYIECTTMPVENYVFLYNIGMAFTYISENKVYIVMPNEIKDVVKKINFKELDVKQERYRNVQEYLLAFSNLYGIFEIEFFMNIFNDNNDEKLDEKEFLDILDKFAGSLGMVEFDDERVIHQALLVNEGEYETLQELREGKEYKILPKEELLKYADEDYVELTEEHIKLKKFLNEMCVDTELAQETFEDICMGLVDSDFDIQRVLFELDRRKIEIKSKKQLEEIVKLVANVSNNSRKWSNKGFTPKELSLRKLNVNANKKIVGRNEPCICGSGKKYKKCCGK
ncbi:SEC-C domain-containing protein [Clostridium senegalense]|uniref:SEC-C metal-binding domain-containing protein n=1 Tax=Clostridium senegalense TaxID=1465809 RepID=UPI001C10F82D|nr:SEC-C metal-binding domain-containing protein [Clostridium senegalense]MBU5225940.1 SEC-C domain-containing protein [Clostridium senegalense]